ncbi:MAG: hypothetical protein AUJ31_01120 [Parcubacteria group bacterium CG1_02_39_15]|uniref:Uncharacterized protein n=1 Tax=candidate division WWE3 bacterium CG_4_8_14_3_um_filter_42_11 TaxID=1975076 RepID=A0A2M8G5Y6_UNCKA|nr:MAG: hypothetical protein AUJ31_01120 [Parcubacteria group bacterium CG1_02_39_15]PJC68330.1 MAG: hypothetical protein CO015_04375 [candidate division WWE3 bacterium CG_4_8_14_3_um_filter_42_11]
MEFTFFSALSMLPDQRILSRKWSSFVFPGRHSTLKTHTPTLAVGIGSSRKKYLFIQNRQVVKEPFDSFPPFASLG